MTFREAINAMLHPFRESVITHQHWRDAVHDFRNSATRAIGAASQATKVSHLAAAEIEATIQLQERITGLRRMELDLLDRLRGGK